MTKVTSLIPLASCVLVACATPPPPPEPAPTPTPVDVTREIEIKQTHDQELKPTGRRAWVGYFRGAERLGPERAADLLASLKGAFRDKGFTMTEGRAKAHVDVSVYPFAREAERENGVTVIAYVNAHGKRPRKWFEQTARMHAPFAEVWDTFAARVVGGVAATELRAPATDVAAQGDPGCVPRFGFQDEEFTDAGQTKYRIARLLPKSPAARAGLRVGDVIEAIDSRPYATFVEDDQGVYEGKITVPLRARRGTEVVRTMIKAEVSCGY